MPRYRPLLLLAAFAPCPLAAQADSARAVVEGKVLDPAGAPIPETEILWQADRRTVMSRPDGSFSLVIPMRGETVILVRRPGFSAQALRVDLTTGVWRGNIVLEPGSYRLPDVIVSARYAKLADYAGTTKFDGFFQRQKLGIGTFISRAQIEQSNATHTLEIFRGIPGLYVNEGIPGNPASADIRIPRCTDAGHTKGSQNLGKVTVWIDGKMELEPTNSGRGMYGPGAMNLAEMLARIAPNGIEMVEVYRGPGEIPGQFHWDGCAAIVIWTRYNPAGPPP